MPADTETANPAPLGLAAFGLTTLLLSFVNAGWLGTDMQMLVVPLGMAYGGTCQLFAGLLSYREGNTFGTTAFTSFGAFWWWFVLLTIFTQNGWLPQVGGQAIGVALITWGVFATYMWVPTFRMNWTLWLIFLGVAVLFYLLGVGNILGIDILVTFGGYVGVLTGLLVLYASFAQVTNWAWDRDLVPLGGTPLKKGDD